MPVKQRLILALEYQDGTRYIYGWASSVKVSGPYMDTQITWARRPKESKDFPSDDDFGQEALSALHEM